MPQTTLPLAKPPPVTKILGWDVSSFSGCALFHSWASSRPRPLHIAAWTRGERNAHARLNDESIRVIRFLCAKGISQKRLATAYGTYNTYICRIARRRAWWWVEDYPARYTIAG